MLLTHRPYRVDQEPRALLLRVPHPRRGQRGAAEGRRRGVGEGAGRVVQHPRHVRWRREAPRGPRAGEEAEWGQGGSYDRERVRLLRWGWCQV